MKIKAGDKLTFTKTGRKVEVLKASNKFGVDVRDVALSGADPMATGYEGIGIKLFRKAWLDGLIVKTEG